MSSRLRQIPNTECKALPYARGIGKAALPYACGIGKARSAYAKGIAEHR